MVKKTVAIFILLFAFPLLAYPAPTQRPDSSHGRASATAISTYTLTAVAGMGGTVTPGRAKVAPGVQKHAKAFTFTPAPKKGVQSITGSYQSNTDYQYVNARTGANIASLPAPIGVKVKVVITSVAGDAFLAGTFAPLAANAGSNQVVLTGTKVTLDGHLSTGDGTYGWTQVSGPTSVTLSDAGTSMATFTAPALPGTYVFSLTHGTSATTTVYVNDSVAQIAKSQCVICHAGQRVGPGVYTNWSGSAHNQISILCSGCHVGANTDAHPGTVNNDTVDPTTFITKVADVNGTLPLGAVFCTYCHTGSKAIPHPTTGQRTTCVACHGGGIDAHTIQPATLPPVVDGATDCSKCHAPENTKFTASKHWNNTFEYSSVTSYGGTFDVFYNGPPATAAGQFPRMSDANVININPNESWNTYEWNKTTGGTDGYGRPAAPVTCSANCHFEARSASGVTGCNACHSGGLKLGGSFKNGSSASYAHNKPAFSSNTCEYCHYSAKGTGHGLTTVEFHASKHWMNTFEYGPEFQGGAVPNQINPNESWTTTENGKLTTCAYNCHFKPNLGPLGPVKADGTPAKDGRAVLRPGLDGCVACHDPHKPTTTAVATCFECHTGSKHGITTNGYKASVHYKSAEFHPTEEELYNSSSYKIIKADCLACHNPHKPEQTTYVAASLTFNSNINVCANCHNGVAAEAKKIGTVVHFASVTTNSGSLTTNSGSFVGNAGRPRNNCSECHFNYNAHTVANFKNNTAASVLSPWADSGHGNIASSKWMSKANDHMFMISDLKPGTASARSTKTINVNNTSINLCVRCHTAKGYAQFVTADAKHAIFTNISAVDIKYGFGTYADSSPLVCSACHTPDTASGATTTALRSVPAAKGFYNVSTAGLGKVVTTHTFPDLKASNICVSCHAGVTGNGEAIRNVFITNNQVYTGTLINPHHGMVADHVTNYGLYEYGDYSAIVNNHMAVGTSAQGPCVGCHFTSTEGHSLEAIDANGIAASPVCTSCHGANFNVTTAKANFDASMLILKNALVAAGLPIKRAAPASGSWGTSPTIRANNMGASMNFYVLYSARTASNPTGGVDPAGYVHNPNYVKRAIFDSIDWAAHGSLTGSIADVLANPTFTAGLSQAQINGAKFGLDHATDGIGSCTACHPGGLPIGNNNLSCIGCHSVAQNLGAGFVQDNNGVRAITGEFTKWSHHVTGVTLQDAHCAACHLEGTVMNGSVTVDTAYHMVDARTHLRNADTDADMTWDSDAPNFSTMDDFCLSCHDSNGATSAGSIAIQGVIIPASGKTASPINPFGDTISNQYDKLERPAVVDAASQFATGNNSHHAVLGKRYSGRSRASKGGTIVDAAFAANSSANLPGVRTTIFDAGKFNASYTTLANSTGETDTPGSLTGRNGGTHLGDDSTLHCGDCHTVGQFRAADVNPATGSFNKAVIGAHGSNNEYLLRNSIGTDARHQGIQLNGNTFVGPDNVTPYLVCYNCHAIYNYGTHAHVGEQFTQVNCNAQVNTNTVNATGSERLISQYTASLGGKTAGESAGADYGNIFGIQCNNCHNSGISAKNIFGGIHGSADPTYQDGVNNTTKHERFLPGLGNVMYVPGTRGGITGGTIAYQSYSSKVQTSGISKGLTLKGTYSYITGGVTNDMNWEEKLRIPVGDGVTSWSHNPGAAGCYTITAGDDEIYNAEANGVPAGPAASKGLTAPNGTVLFGNWGGCDDHSQQAGASVRQPRSGNTSIRPVTY